jgi:hypothetical protein
MRCKSAVIALSFSFAFLIPLTSYADSILTLETTSGGAPYGEDIFPYQMQLQGPGGTGVYNMSCLNYNLEISFGESWYVVPYMVNAIVAGGVDVDGMTPQQFQEDAWLFNQYSASGSSNVAGVGTVTNADIQYAIWNIMDNGHVPLPADGNAQLLDTQAASVAPGLYPSYYANDMVFVPDLSNTTGWTNGTPQYFMTDPPPPVMTPEPTSLVLLATGMLGLAAILHRRLHPAQVKA